MSSSHEWLPYWQAMLDEARRGLDVQRADLESLRNRAGVLAGLGSTATFLAASMSLHPVALTAVALLAAMLVLYCGLVVAPIADLKFTQDIEQMGLRGREQDTPAQAIEQAAYWCQEDREHNRKLIDQRHKSFRIATGFFLAVMFILVVTFVVDSWV